MKRNRDYFKSLNMSSPSNVERFLPKRSSGNLGGGGPDCTGAGAGGVLYGARYAGWYCSWSTTFGSISCCGTIMDWRLVELCRIFFHHEVRFGFFLPSATRVEGVEENIEDLSSLAD